MNRKLFPILLAVSLFTSVNASAQKKEGNAWIDDIKVTHTENTAKRTVKLFLISLSEDPKAIDTGLKLYEAPKVNKATRIAQTKAVLQKHAAAEELLTDYKIYQKAVESNDLFAEYALVTDYAENFDKLRLPAKLYFIQFFLEPFLASKRAEKYLPIDYFKRDGVIHLTLEHDIELIINAHSKTIHFTAL